MDLILVQTICKSYQQMTSHGKQGKDLKVTLVDKQLNKSLFMFLNDMVNVLKF